MKQFLSNPLEYTLNLMGYTMVKKKSLLLDHILRKTHNTWLEDLYDSNRIQAYQFKYWTE